MNNKNFHLNNPYVVELSEEQKRKNDELKQLYREMRRVQEQDSQRLNKLTVNMTGFIDYSLRKEIILKEEINEINVRSHVAIQGCYSALKGVSRNDAEIKEVKTDVEELKKEHGEMKSMLDALIKSDKKSNKDFCLLGEDAPLPQSDPKI